MSQVEPGTVASEEASLQLHESGAVILYLARDAASRVTLTLPRMESIAKLLRQVRDQKPSGLVITSTGNGGFCSGFDASVKASFSDPVEAETLALSGQELCRAFETLPCTTVAAINGACIGEGLELALSCTYRVASGDSRTILSLPHVPLGVVPPFGTLGRLPKLIGISRSLQLVLDGRGLKPGEALAANIVDEVVAQQALFDHAVKTASGGHIPRVRRRSFISRLIDGTELGRKHLRKQVTNKVRCNPGAHPESASAAVESLFSSCEPSSSWRPEHDARTFGKLALGQESKALLRVAQLKDAAKKIGSIAVRDVEHVHALVLGAGRMGAGITAALAVNECAVVVKDPSQIQLRNCLEQVKKHVAGLSGMSEAEKSFVLNRIEMTARDSANFGNTSVAVEAVQEDLAVKSKALEELCGSIPEEAVIATHTASYSITALAEGVIRPSRFLGLHFFPPAETHELVEVIMGGQTGNRAIAVATALVCKMGKFPIVVRDVPGFLVFRVMNAFFQEAFQLLHEGFSPGDIDNAAAHFGFVSGPFAMLDLLGLDSASEFLEALTVEHGDQLRTHPFCRILAKLGRKGLKTGAGFYDYGRNGARDFPGLRAALNIPAPHKPVTEPQLIEDRLVFALVNEAVDAMDHEIAGKPGPEAANQIDLGLVLGGGFPALKGGPLYWAQTLGADVLLETLKKLEVKHGTRFKASEGIVKRARSGQSFIA